MPSSPSLTQGKVLLSEVDVVEVVEDVVEVEKNNLVDEQDPTRGQQ